MTSQFNYPLMKNNFERSDFYQVKKILNSKDPILTQSFYTKKF